MSGKEFEKELAKLQIELVRLQTWVQAKKHASSWSSRAATQQASGVISLTTCVLIASNNCSRGPNGRPLVRIAELPFFPMDRSP